MGTKISVLFSSFLAFMGLRCFVAKEIHIRGEPIYGLHAQLAAAMVFIFSATYLYRIIRSKMKTDTENAQRMTIGLATGLASVLLMTYFEFSFIAYFLSFVFSFFLFFSYKI